MGDEERDALYLRDHRMAAAERHLEALDDRVREVENRMIRVDTKLDTVIRGQEEAKNASLAAKATAGRNTWSVILGILITIVTILGTHYFK